MLDDLKMIHDRDAQDALGIVARQADQLRIDFGIEADRLDGIQNVVYGALGGSALAAWLTKAWPGYGLPFEVVRDYDLPAYVSEHTLCIFASYSGNTEETLAALAQAEDRGARIAVISGGGRLADRARAKGYPLAVLPRTAQPRYAVLANFKAILDLMQAFGLLDPEVVRSELPAAADFLDRTVGAWAPEIPTVRNPAKQLAQELMGRSIVVYSGPFLAPAAYKWKIAANENAKQVAWTGQYPEFNHNEFAGWSQQPVDKPYAVIDLRSSFDNQRIQKRFDISAKLLSGRRPSSILVDIEGETRLHQLVWALAYGDFVTIYLALLNGLDPVPLEIVDKLKQLMEK